MAVEIKSSAEREPIRRASANSTPSEIIKELIADPQKLILRKPFTRGLAGWGDDDHCGDELRYDEVLPASLPSIKRVVVTQEQYMAELDPRSHKVLFDDNIPSITMKLNDGSYMDIKYERMAVSYQRNIRDKHVLHLCGHPMQFTLMNTDPTDKDTANFITFKQYWELRNQDGMRTKMVSAAKSLGDAGLLFYRDYKGRIKSRLISYEDGYVICSHDDDNGDRILESIYYEKDNVKYIDSYDDTYMYRHVCDMNIARNGGSPEWIMETPKKHGFSEIPLVTKRCKVAWDNVQSIIEVYEVIYNIFLVIQKRHGWGILYIKGQFNENAKKIAGAIVLNDTSLDGSGSAEFKTPPSPQNMIDTLGLMEETIQKGSGATFLLPKDVKSTGDISAQAIMLTQSLDIENALQGVIEWQNVADKMCRLFKEGLAQELVSSGENPQAYTEFKKLNINAKFRVWRPQSDTEYNNMISSLAGAGLISKETGIEKNTLSTPDEKSRLAREEEAKEKKEAQAQELEGLKQQQELERQAAESAAATQEAEQNDAGASASETSAQVTATSQKE